MNVSLWVSSTAYGSNMVGGIMDVLQGNSMVVVSGSNMVGAPRGNMDVVQGNSVRQ